MEAFLNRQEESWYCVHPAVFAVFLRNLSVTACPAGNDRVAVNVSSACLRFGAGDDALDDANIVLDYAMKHLLWDLWVGRLIPLRTQRAEIGAH